jgi:hypothetical protein
MAPLVTASVTNPILGNGPIQRIIPHVGNCRKWSPRELASDAVTTDEFEVWFDKGVTDGLPVVPPTRERVERMLSGTRRSPGELLGERPPNYGWLTIEKAAINTVLAGCRPEYLRVVIAASECACDPAFNLHGVSTSTHFSAPLIVVNGPIRGRIGLNSGFGVFGPGYRANATSGRALRLLMINVGGARPGEISMSTFGHPGCYTFCIGEHEEASPWPPFHAGRGLPPGPPPSRCSPATRRAASPITRAAPRASSVGRWAGRWRASGTAGTPR